MPDDELVDIYDDNLRKIGAATRQEAHEKGEWHLNFHCWVVTNRSGGSLLFQVRSKKKPTFPGKLDSTVGGHYKSNEALQGVIREVHEEIGLKVDVHELIPLGRRIDIASVGGMPKREVANVFLLRRDLPLNRYRLEPTEVEGLVEVPMRKGTALFAGEVRRVRASGIEWLDKSKRWLKRTRTLSQKDFVPKVDSYYSTLFIMVERFLAGERHLSI